MNLLSAYKILGLNQSATEDEVKKKFRELTKKYHPDVNKEQDTTEKFREIKEAYEAITNKNNNQIYYKSSEPEDISINISISFRESVEGCIKELKYTRQLACKKCNGAGSINDNGCSKCNGNGTIVERRGMTIITKTCSTCYGKKNMIKCDQCFGIGAVNAESTIKIKIPPGGIEGSTLRISNMGNFSGPDFSNFNIFGFNNNGIYSDLLIKIEKITDCINGAYIKDNRLNTDLHISLLDALVGKSIEIETIDGTKIIDIKPNIKNKDVIEIKNLGIGRTNPHYINVYVNYPENTKDLINFLNSNKEG